MGYQDEKREEGFRALVRSTRETVTQLFEAAAGTGIYEQLGREIDALEEAIVALDWKVDTEGIQDPRGGYDYDSAYELMAGK